MQHKPCDLVMKGGITSGIVYPRAVCELAKEYRFANIGGTSAGAIAAALTAAAEYRRQQGSDDGFAKLEQLPEWLASDNNLLRLFQPNDDTAPLLDVALRALQSRWSALRALLGHFNRFGGAVAAIGALVLAFSWRNPIAAAYIVIVTAIAFVLASIVELLVYALRVLPRNRYGLCSGAGATALTEWLADQIDDVATAALSGRGAAEGSGTHMHPLTFKDLEDAGVRLEVMTTNLTHGRPYRLPLESKQFLFSEKDFRELFPTRVVDFMIARSTPRRGGLYVFPQEQLPIIVAARMSLSFPLLLTAVPLYASDFGRRDGNYTPELCWFSDGGITSNFPVHFFDAPLPRWPTFAINLNPHSERYHEAEQRIFAPTTTRSGIVEWWRAIDGLPSFLWSIVTTMQNWHDNMLLRMPGYRDRIAHVLLGAKEGGLNLTMDPATITDVAERGRSAARTLRERFSGEGWRNHQWIRFLSFMRALDDAGVEFARGYDERLLDESTALPSTTSAASAP
ncbi:MAG TPA: patatin-like phospholipase family protein [Thermoanaerobaculia bacterium]|nr:patatin-like phospholipase family protein [Thermoanaerobaculia bacterium]